MAITFLTAQQRLARLMGDADSSGTAQYAKWSQQEYKDAINFACELLRERFLLPHVEELSWVEGTYDYDPDTLVYIYEIMAEAGTGLGSYSPVAGTSLFEYTVPLDLITVKRTTSDVLRIHFDKEEVLRHHLNQTGLKVRLYGYEFQVELSADGDSLRIPWSSVLPLAKLYMHLAAEGRDPNEIMKHSRQIRETLQAFADKNDEDIEVPGGIWLVTR